MDDTNFTVDTLTRAQAEQLLARALRAADMPWGRGKIMFVGPGGAGKTGTVRAMMGRPFEHTESTVGIDDGFTCDVTTELASVGELGNGGVSAWKEVNKAEKEYEAALAKVADMLRRGVAVEEVAAALQEDLVAQEEKRAQAANAAREKAAAEAAAAAKKTSGSGVGDGGGQSSSGGQAAATVAAGPSSGGDDNKDSKGATVSKPKAAAMPAAAALAPLSAPAKPPDVDADYFAKTLANEHDLNAKLSVTMFDFGGQEVFNVIHPFFLTRYGVYIVCFNMKKWFQDKEQCSQDIKAWVDSIMVHTRGKKKDAPFAACLYNASDTDHKAPIFLVGTHKDRVSDMALLKELSEGIFKLLGGKHPVWDSLITNAKDDLFYFPLDNTKGRDDPTMQHLMHEVEATIEAEEYVQQKRPMVWFRVLDWINGASRACLTYEEVRKYAATVAMDTAKQVDEMLAFFHEMGVLMWHRDEGLHQLVIVKPVAFIVKSATVVVCQHTGTAVDNTVHELQIHKEVKRDGRLKGPFQDMVSRGVATHRLLERLLSSEESKTHWTVVLQLMVKYGLLVPLRLEEGEDPADANYLVPALLPDAPAASAGTTGPAPDGHTFFFYFSAARAPAGCLRASQMREDGFLPGGLFVRLIGKALNLAAGSTGRWTCYKRMFELSFGHQRFVVTHLPDENAIKVQLIGPGTPLAVHARLEHLLQSLIQESFESLHMDTLVQHNREVAIQGALRPSSASSMHPTYVPVTLLRDAFKNQKPLVMTDKVHIMQSELDALFGPWIVKMVNQQKYDVFIDYRWGAHDSPLTAKLVDHLEWYTVGEAHPRPLVAFLDRRSLELGKDFQESFVAALQHSTVYVVILSHNLLQRMCCHDPGNVDNALMSMMVALYLHRRKVFSSILPVFIGARGDVDSRGALDRHGLGGNFFAPVAEHNLRTQSILQALPDILPTETLRMAVELLHKTGMWPAEAAREASQVDPQLFGLTSFSVRAVINQFTKFNGIFADSHNTMFDLLRSVGKAVHDLVATVESENNPPRTATNKEKTAEGVVSATQISQAQPSSLAPPFSSTKPITNADGKHVMVSYAWKDAAKPELVEAITVYLRNHHGYDVCRDKEGSSLMPPMGGSTDAWMAAAIENSHTIIMFVSREYSSSINCMKEAIYAHTLKDAGKVEIIYVMMQDDYVPWPPRCDMKGELALWIGNKLCYSLFDKSKIESVGNTLAGLIGDKGKLMSGPNAPVLSIPWAQLRFEAREDIGKGSFGKVFKATWLPHSPATTDSQPVAVKVITASVAAALGRDYNAERTRAIQEAERIAQICKKGGQVLRDHVLHVFGYADGRLPPPVTELFGLRDGEEALGIVMRLEAGGSLEMMLHSTPQASPVDYAPFLSDTKNKLILVEQIARGLAELHKIGLVHGDLKPANILVDGKLPPSLVIADFGLSDLRERVEDTVNKSTMYGTSNVHGTPAYCAPETLVPDDVSGQMTKASRSTDVYSFGIIAWEVLSGVRPFSNAGNVVHIGLMVGRGDRPPAEALPTDTPADIVDMIRQCWDGNRSVRPTAAQCYAMIQQCTRVSNLEDWWKTIGNDK